MGTATARSSSRPRRCAFLVQSVSRGIPSGAGCSTSPEDLGCQSSTTRAERVSGGLVGGNVLTPLKPAALVQFRASADVVDDQGRSVRNQVGELVVRAPWIGMTRGFWKDDRRYEETYWSRFPNVWVHGDWAEIDDDGLWYILGRSDDTIKIAGKRVGPAEVESVLVEHPSVIEAAAIGVPDELKGQSLACFCVLRPGTPSPALADELKALLPSIWANHEAASRAVRLGLAQDPERQSHAPSHSRRYL